MSRYRDCGLERVISCAVAAKITPSRTLISLESCPIHLLRERGNLDGQRRGRMYSTPPPGVQPFSGRKPVRAHRRKPLILIDNYKVDLQARSRAGRDHPLSAEGR
jgi:hypothetical protein